MVRPNRILVKKNNMQIAGNKTIKDWRNLVGDAKNLKIDYNTH